jgi:hypothetical protein
MRIFSSVILIFLASSLAGCASGNVKSPKDYNAPPAPAVQHPYYDPYAAYGEANASWRPPVIDRNRTMVKPAEPSSQSDRPKYESAPWATGASGGSVNAPPGTL